MRGRWGGWRGAGARKIFGVNLYEQRCGETGTLCVGAKSVFCLSAGVWLPGGLR